MKTRASQNVGVEIYDVDICNLTENDYEEIKEIFFNNLLVVIRDQPVLTLPFAKIVYSIGKSIANHGQAAWNFDGDEITPGKFVSPFAWTGADKDYPVQRVTGMKKNNQDTGIFGAGKLDWHSNMNGAFNRAPGVALQGVSGVEGSSTSWMDTTAAYNDLSDEMKKRCENVVGVFEYSLEVWAEGLPKWQYDLLIKNKDESYEMPLVNRSVKGKPGLYFHYLNKCRFPSDPELLEILKKHCFQEKYIYTLDWRPGDIHLSDQVLTLHKRNQDDPEILARRVLHRYTFNFKNPNWPLAEK